MYACMQLLNALYVIICWNGTLPGNWWDPAVHIIMDLNIVDFIGVRMCFFFLVYILWCITEILVKLFLSHQLNQARSCQNANGSINMPSAIIRLMPWYRSVNLMVVLNHSSVICHTVSVLTAMEIKNQTPVLMSDMEHQYAMTQVWMWELLC